MAVNIRCSIIASSKVTEIINQLIKAITVFGLTLILACGSNSKGPEKTPKLVSKPNVLFIVADDMALSDINAFGSEIDTPNINRLVNSGLSFTAFHTSPMCSPSRAMLLTGVDQHRTGYGAMNEFRAPNQEGVKGYEGYLNDRVATAPELLKPFGYNTYMAGKWHLGERSKPSNRGFDNSTTLIQGAGSHFNNEGYGNFQPSVTYLRDGVPIALPKDFYSSDFYADEMLKYIQSGRGDGKPFFGYLAFSAPHWPLHAPKKTITKYKDTYVDGWHALREARHAGLKKTGIIAHDATLPRSLEAVLPWEQLSPEKKAYEAKLMAVYAAMVDRMDYNIGRVLDDLESHGELDNTIIVFTSDNGPEAIDFTAKPIFPPTTNWIKANYENTLENLGSPKSYEFYGQPWAQAGAASHRFYKTVVSEGGIHSPLIISWPNGSIQSGKQTSAFSTLVDIIPTILEFTGAQKNPDKEALSGRSLTSVLNGSTNSVYPPFEGQGFGLIGNEAYIAGEWKIMRLRKPLGSGKWGLYNLTADPGETTDLSKDRADVFEKLMANYETYKRVNNVIIPGPDYQMF